MSVLTPDYLRHYVERYSLTTFVETGCFRGEGIAAALASGFEMVISCDIDPRMVNHCKSRFGGNSRIEILEGNSLSCLQQVLSRDLGPTAFWLDAHYPAFYDLPQLENDHTRFPIRQELALIREKREYVFMDVILVDDMRVIKAEDNPRWRPGEVSDYFLIDHISITELIAPFLKTHHASVENWQEGVLTFTPLSKAAR